MTAALLAYAALAGIVIVEGLRAVLGRIGVRRRLSQVQNTLRAFRATTDDDARQRLIMQAGLRTLSLSFLLFAALASACVVMVLPLRWIATSSVTLTAYMVALTVAALLWWNLRRSRLRW